MRIPIKAIFIALSSDMINRGLIFAYSVIAARELDKAGYAIFGLALQVANFVWVLADMGVTAFAIRRIAVLPDADKVKQFVQVTITRIASSVIVLCCIALAIFLLPFPSHEKNIYLAAVCIILANSVLPAWYMRGAQHDSGYFMVYLFLGLSMLCAIGIVMVFHGMGVAELVSLRTLSILLGSIVAIIYLLYKVKKHLLTVERRYFSVNAELLKVSFPLSFAALFVVAFQTLPLVMVRFHGNLSYLSDMAVVWQVMMVTISLLSGVQLVFAPKHARSAMVSVKSLNKSLCSHLGLILLVGVIGVGLSEAIGGVVVVALFGKEYITVEQYLPMTALVVAIYLLRTMFGNLLIIKEQSRELLSSAVMAAMVGAAMLYALPVESNHNIPLSALLSSEFVLLLNYIVKSPYKILPRTYHLLIGSVAAFLAVYLFTI